MSGNQDARPFVDLQKDAEEFRQKFDGDIQKCRTFLDAKITALICDPDSLVSPSKKSSIKQNALVEFSKAKYDIFISVKSLVNEMEREWIKYISEMKKLFIENVEIFLAGTKLEVKLPTAEFQTSPALGSPLRNKEGNIGRKSPKEILDDSLLRNDKEISDDESDSEDKSVKQAQDGQLRRGSARAILLKDNSAVSGGRVARHARNEVESSDSAASDSESVPKSKSPTVTRKQSDDSDKVPKSKSPAVTYKQSDDSDKGVDSTDVNLNERGRRNESKSANSRVSQAKSSFVAKKNENNKEHVSPQVSRATRGRTGKETKSSSSQEQNALPQGSKSRGGRFGKEADSSSSQDRDASPQNSKSLGSRSRKDTNSSSSQDSKSRESRLRKDASSSSSQEHDILPQTSKLKRGRSGKDTNSSSSEERDASPQHSALRGGRSRKEAISSLEASQEHDMSSQISKSKRGQPGKETKSSLLQANSTLKSKGRSSVKPTASKKQALGAPAEMTEAESEEKIAVESSTRPSRQRGRTPGKPDRFAVQKSSSTTEESESGSTAQMSTTTEESESESTKQSPRSVTKGKKGKTPAKHRQNKIDVEPRSTRRGATRETPVAPPSPKKSNIANNYPEFERSKSPKKVTFTPKLDTSHLDAFTPNLKSKSSIRRKTLLPNLNEIESEDDIIPGTSRGRANKRKTIGGISGFASATPPKRLKVGESRKSVSSNQVDDDADDNLLENDGAYSDWIPLKSIDGKIPTKPGIYEVKVWRAKKPAYIGHCESLRQKLTIHKLRQNSGHKHLDKFIERNMADIQIRYEVMSSNDSAKSEVKNRVKNFVSEYKTTPAYN